jgi:hypothetical protein
MISGAGKVDVTKGFLLDELTVENIVARKGGKAGKGKGGLGSGKIVAWIAAASVYQDMIMPKMVFIS